MRSEDKWPEFRIGDLGRVVTGRTPSSANKDAFGDKFPFITPSDMDGRRKMDSTERWLSATGANLVASSLVPAGSVAVSCIGWQMGKAVLTTRPSFTNQQLNTVIPNDRVQAPFLYYVLSTKQQELKNLGSAGTRTPILNKSRFEDVIVSLPKPAVQARIVDVLSAYDDLIENNTKRIKILEEMARSLYREWFVEHRIAGQKRVASGRLPEGWTAAVLGDIVEEVRDAVDPTARDPNTPYFGLEHLPRRSTTLFEWGIAAEVQSTKLLVRKGDILFGKIRPYFHKVGLSPVAAICSSDAIVIRPKEDRFRAVTLACVSSDDFVAQATASSQGTKMPRANWDVMCKYPLTLLPRGLLDRFNAIAGAAAEMAAALGLKNRVLATTRDLLLPRLLSGEIELHP